MKMFKYLRHHFDLRFIDDISFQLTTNRYGLEAEYTKISQEVLIIRKQKNKHRSK